MRWTPYKFQVRAAKFLLDHAGAGLWLDPGLGKTSITLAALEALREAHNLQRALVIAPLRVAQITWPEELRKWSDFKHLKAVLLHGPDKDDLLHEECDINIINPEGLKWLVKSRSTGFWPWNVLVVDESTKFKSWSAQRTKILRGVLDRFDRRWTLTGTPAPNGLQDVFAQAYIMDGGKALGPYITHFRSRFMIQGGYLGYEWFPRDGAWHEVAARLAPIVMRLDAKDWLDIPEMVHNMIEVELPPEARNKYRELEKEFFLKLDQGNVIASNAAALGMKLRQATNGIIYTDGEDVSVLHKEKLDALEDLLEEMGGSPILVAVAFRSEVAAICQHLGKKIPYLGGGVSASEARDTVAEWNKGKLPVLLAHPTSVAHGLNLQFGAHHVCWFGLTWNFEEYDQFIRRVWRQGQKERVIVHQIVARKTMDQAIGLALQEKDRNQAGLMNLIKKYRGKK